MKPSGPIGAMGIRSRFVIYGLALILSLGAVQAFGQPAILQNFDGVDSYYPGTGYPPDPNLAAGPNHVVEMVNLVGRVWNKSGGIVQTFDLRPFFEFASGTYLTDPVVRYDSVSGRWFASIAGNTTLNLAVSQSDDPTGSWWVYHFSRPDLPDYPRLGMSDDKVVVSFLNTGSGGHTAYILNKAELISGSAADYVIYTPTGYTSTPQPVVSLSGTTTEYMIDNSFTGSLTLYSITGIPGVSPVNVTTTALPFNPTMPPPEAEQLGAPDRIETLDDRLLSAVWRDGTLWTSATEGCVPPGDTAVRSCLRLIEATIGGTALPSGSIQFAAIGDLNGDGHSDLAVANSGINGVSILLGDGTGAFGPPADFPAGNDPQSLVISDFNGDGKLDLAVMNVAGSGVSVLLGDGVGAFGPPSSYPVGNYPQSIAVGDLNMDGKPDLAVANSSDDTVSILLGDGTGSFGAATNYAVGSNPLSVAVGDLDGDGNPDLAVANFNDDNVSVLIGNGDGTFLPHVESPAGDGADSVAVGDFNSDGKLDLAVTDFYINKVSFLFNNGDGTFALPINWGTGNAPGFVALGDFDQDGWLDVAVANAYTDTVSILIGNGDGTFHVHADFTAGNSPKSVAIGDLTGDGYPDLAAANPGPNTVSLLFGDGAGGFSAPSTVGWDLEVGVVQDMTIGLADYYYFFPAVITDADGNLEVVFGRSSASEHPGLRVTGRLLTDPLNTIQSSGLLWSGQAPNTSERWGDYFGAALDPSDTSTVWVTGEYGKYGGTEWGTRVAQLKFGAAPPDLVLTQVTPNASTAYAGATLPVTTTVENQGGLPAGSSSTAFRLSVNAIYGDADDIVISTAQSVGSLAIGASYTATTSLAIPATIAVGSYYVCAEADATSAVDEGTNEGNNTRCSGSTVSVAPANLTLQTPTTTSTVVAPGETLDLWNKVTNTGGVPVGAFIIAFHLSADAVFGGTDDITFTTTRSVGSLAAGTSSTATTSLTVPSTTPTGSYYVCAFADSGDAVSESNENDNGACTASTVSIAPYGTPVVDSADPSPLAYAFDTSKQVTIMGSQFVVGATITLEGPNGSLSGVTIAGSSANANNPFVFVNDTKLKFWWDNTSLSPGAYDVTVTNPGAGSPSGTLAGGFVVEAPQPTVDSLSYSSLTYGIDLSKSVSISGSDFLEGATITLQGPSGSLSGVTVAGSSATATQPFVQSSSSTVKFWWDQTGLPPGTYDVTVTNPAAAGGASVTLPGGFVVEAPEPTVDSLSYSDLTYGIDLSKSVSIYGSNFLLGATITLQGPSGSLSGVTVDGGSSATASVPFVYYSKTSLKIWWDQTGLPPGTYDVTVTNPAAGGGLSGTLAGGFVVEAPQPTVSSLSYSDRVYGIDISKSITITGNDFLEGATITISGPSGSLSGVTVDEGTYATASVPFVYYSKTSLRFWWDQTGLPPGTYDVTVTNPAAGGGLSDTRVGGFVVEAPQPTISSVTASSVTYGVTASKKITISGSNFLEGATITVSGPGGSLSGVTVAGSNPTPTEPFVFYSKSSVRFWWDNTSLSPGTYDVTVTNPTAGGGLSVTEVGGFTVN
jgi:FG-GAP-like repeat/CARDB